MNRVAPSALRGPRGSLGKHEATTGDSPLLFLQTDAVVLPGCQENGYNRSRADLSMGYCVSAM
jgi:hypothetical protein